MLRKGKGRGEAELMSCKKSGEEQVELFTITSHITLPPNLQLDSPKVTSSLKRTLLLSPLVLLPRTSSPPRWSFASWTAVLETCRATY